ARDPADIQIRGADHDADRGDRQENSHQQFGSANGHITVSSCFAERSDLAEWQGAARVRGRPRDAYSPVSAVAPTFSISFWWRMYWSLWKAIRSSPATHSVHSRPSEEQYSCHSGDW